MTLKANSTVTIKKELKMGFFITFNCNRSFKGNYIFNYKID